MAFNFEKKNSSSSSKQESKTLGFLNVNLGTKAGGQRKIALGAFTDSKEQEVEFHNWIMSAKTEEEKAQKLAIILSKITLTYNAAEASEGSFFDLP